MFGVLVTPVTSDPYDLAIWTAKVRAAGSAIDQDLHQDFTGVRRRLVNLRHPKRLRRPVLVIDERLRSELALPVSGSVARLVSATKGAPWRPAGAAA